MYLADSLIDWCILTFSSSSSRVWSWSTTVKTVRVSSALSGRQRPGLHFWISATVLLMDWIFCSTVCRHRDIQKNWFFKTNHRLVFVDFGLLLSWRSHHVDIKWKPLHSSVSPSGYLLWGWAKSLETITRSWSQPRHSPSAWLHSRWLPPPRQQKIHQY